MEAKVIKTFCPNCGLDIKLQFGQRCPVCGVYIRPAYEIQFSAEDIAGDWVVVSRGYTGKMAIREKTKTILEKLSSIGKVYIVGGYVRDYVMSLEPKDIDIEVYGVDMDRIVEILSMYADVDLVGKSFGILKVDLRKIGGDEIDVSIPRRESKAGCGHKGFVVEPDPTMTLEEACSRRDFTFNSMLLEFPSMTVIDIFGGMDDIRKRVIRHTSPAFAEDPLRVLRAVQFGARFGFSMAQETIELSKSLLSEFDSLPVERVGIEFSKLFRKGKYISNGLEILRQTQWIEKFPELQSMIGCQQEKQWHPEGDVWQHTLQVCDYAAYLADIENLSADDREVLLLSALLHDVGKPLTTKVVDGKITSYGHEKAGIEPAKRFLRRINCEKSIVARVLKLIESHMRHLNSTQKSVRKLAVDIQPASIRLLSLLIEADNNGRKAIWNYPQARYVPDELKKFIELSEHNQVSDNPIAPIITGHHLIQIGMKPSPEFKKILAYLYELQLDGKILSVDNGIKIIREKYGWDF